MVEGEIQEKRWEMEDHNQPLPSSVHQLITNFVPFISWFINWLAFLSFIIGVGQYNSERVYIPEIYLKTKL